MSLSSAQDETVLLCLHPYKANVGPEQQDTDHEAGLNFVNYYLDGVQAGEMDPSHIMCSAKAQFLCGGYVNCHNKKNYLTKNSMLMHTVPSHDVKVYVCCAVSAASNHFAHFF